MIQDVLVIHCVGDAGYEGNHAVRAAEGDGPRNHDHLFGSASLAKNGLDFLQLHPVTTNLDLLVDSPEIIQPAVFSPPDQVPRAVPRSLAGFWETNELTTSVLGVVPITVGYLRSR